MNRDDAEVVKIAQEVENMKREQDNKDRASIVEAIRVLGWVAATPIIDHDKTTTETVHRSLFFADEENKVKGKILELIEKL